MNLRDRVFMSSFFHSTVWFSFGLLPSFIQHLWRLVICQPLCYAYAYIVKLFSCQKEGIPYEIEFLVDMTFRFMNKFFWQPRNILGLWHDGHFVTWSQWRSSLRNQFCWECFSLRPFTGMRTNGQGPMVMASGKDYVLVQAENGFLLNP